MSSRRSSSSRRGAGGEGGGSPYYPTQWSKWEWNEQYQCHSRYRLKGPGDYEYDFDYGPAQTEETPRTKPPLGPIAQQSHAAPYPAETNSNYTTAREGDLGGITQSLAQTTLSPGTSSHFQPYSLSQSVPYTQPQTDLYAHSQSASYTQSQTTPYNQPQSGPNFITTRNISTLYEDFDPHYKVHGGWEFKFGKIFKVLWTEPKGNDGHGSTGGSSTGATISERPGKHGEVHHEKVRRFVIINAMDGHCICLPIMTYGGQGVNKRGVHAKHHTIIHTGSKPVMFKGEKEKGLIKKPIRVEPVNARHKLDKASRLNYAKPYTVEYNVKVWFIGKVHSDSEWRLTTDYNRVHPPLPSRGSRQPDDASDDGNLYPAGYFQNTYGGGSSYPSTSGYPSTFSPSVANSSPYSMSPPSGVGMGISSYTSHPSLDPVAEHEPGEAGPSGVFDSSDPPQGYGGSEEAAGYGHRNTHDEDYHGQEPPVEPDQEEQPDHGDIYDA